MTLTKRFEENKLTIIGTAILLLLLAIGFQSGIFSSWRRQLYHRRGNVRPPVRLLSELCRNGHRFCNQFSPGKTLWADLSLNVCIRRNLSEIHFLGRKRKEIRCIFPSGSDPARYA